MALLLLVSGMVKLKAAERVALGLPALALLELVAGLGLMVAVFVRTFTAGQGLAVLVGSVALVVVSSVQVGMAVRRRQRLRTASEGARLTNYLKYLSAQNPPSE